MDSSPTNATGYRIRYRSQDTSGGFTPSWRTTSVQGRTTRTKDIPSLTINTTGNPSYEFQIQGVNGSKRSNYSSSATAIPNKQCSSKKPTCAEPEQYNKHQTKALYQRTQCVSIHKFAKLSNSSNHPRPNLCK